MDFENAEGANPMQGAEPSQTPQPETSVPSQGAPAYETIAGEDGSEFIKLPKSEFDKYVQGNMREEEYTRSKQAISDLIQLLEESGESPSQQPQQPPQAKPNVGQPQQRVAQNKMAGLPEATLKSYVEPLYNQLAKIEFEKELNEFKGEFAGVFSGDKTRDDEILMAVLRTAQTYLNADGTPMSLKQAFYTTYGPNMYQALASRPKPKPEWGTEDTSLTSGPTRPLNSLEDADDALEKTMSQQFGERY
jgi:hypothetical protein